jgi:putative SOS response-associated peptidase YedK
MCGRAKLPDDVSEIKLDLKIDFDQIGDYRPRWNAAPTSKLPVVISKVGTRILTLMRWGLIPSWARDLKIGYSTFNARAESLTTRAAFRGAWQAGRRCLVLADCWADWLGENAMTERAVKNLLRPYPDQAMAFWAVDRRVGNVRNDSPDLFAPLTGSK